MGATEQGNGQAVAAETPDESKKEARHAETSQVLQGCAEGAEVQRNMEHNPNRGDYRGGASAGPPLSERVVGLVTANQIAVEVGIGNQDSGSGNHLDDSGLAGCEVDGIAPTGGQTEDNGNCPPVGSKPKKRKPRAKKNVLAFKLPTGGQRKTKGGKQKTSSKLPTGGQDAETEWLKSLLPTAKTGDWWETPADDKGFKIKYRWRTGGQKGTYVFRRLGKRDIQTLKEQPYERQVWLIADRIFGELRSKDRADVTARISPRPLLDRVAGAEN